jgi:hypothetical protein
VPSAPPAAAAQGSRASRAEPEARAAAKALSAPDRAPQPLAAPQRDAELRRSRALQLAEAAPPDDPVVVDIERRVAAGELSEARRRPGGCVEDRRAWIDAAPSRIHKVVEWRAGGVTLTRWFDARGRLRAATVARGGGAARLGLDEGGAVVAEHGVADPALRALALEARDPSAAFFGPPRCDDAAPAGAPRR